MFSATHMLKVTVKAKRELKRILETRAIEPGSYLRLATPPVWKGEGDFGIVIDQASPADSVLLFRGLKLLIFDPHLAGHWNNAVLDFKPSPTGYRFTLDIF